MCSSDLGGADARAIAAMHCAISGIVGHLAQRLDAEDFITLYGFAGMTWKRPMNRDRDRIF